MSGIAVIGFLAAILLVAWLGALLLQVVPWNVGAIGVVASSVIAIAAFHIDDLIDNKRIK